MSLKEKLFTAVLFIGYCGGLLWLAGGLNVLP